MLLGRNYLKRLAVQAHGMFLFLVLCPAVLPSLAWGRPGTDEVWLLNGDRLTGEIRQLEHGKLRLSTDAMGELRIEWDEIVRIRSDYSFQFERSDGTRVTGRFEHAAGRSGVGVRSGDDVLSFDRERVVRISPIEDGFLDRLQGSLSLGYSFTKASNVAQGNLSGSAQHRTEVRELSLDGSTIITSDQEDDSTQRSNLQFGMRRFRADRWFNSYLGGLESNDELGLNVRASAGAAVGRYLQQSNVGEFAILGGAVVTVEDFTGQDDRRENIEGLIGLDYSRYIYDHPALDLSVRLSAFPSFTESGRYRGQFDLNLRWEVINDLFWDLSYYNTYDSDPSTQSEATSDNGIVTSLGLSF